MIDLKNKEWKIKNIETIFFDKDGTLVDLHYFWGKMIELRANAIIEKYCINPNSHSNICAFFGFNKTTQKMFPNGITALYSRPRIIELLLEELKNYQIKSSTKEIEEIFNIVSESFYENLENYIKPINEAIDFAKEIKKRGIETAIITADSIISTEKTLKFLNIENLFDIIIARESHKERKETGKPTLFALNKLKANPMTTIMIGDTPIDCISAKNAGIKKTILLETGQMTEKELKTHSCYIAKNLSEVTIQ